MGGLLGAGLVERTDAEGAAAEAVARVTVSDVEETAVMLRMPSGVACCAGRGPERRCWCRSNSPGYIEYSIRWKQCYDSLRLPTTAFKMVSSAPSIVVICFTGKKRQKDIEQHREQAERRTQPDSMKQQVTQQNSWRSASGVHCVYSVIFNRDARS